MIKSISYLFFIFVVSSNLMLSQQEGEAKPGEAKPGEAKPLELPNYIIEGRGQINVQSGIKQAPDKINKLTKLELDSINSLKKEQTVLLPVKQLPSSYLNITRKHGMLSGEFGSYITPLLTAGYEFNIKDYLFVANGMFETSSGDAKNSEYLKTSASLMAENVAPDKFFIFGGSRTESNLEIGYHDYNLYASSIPIDRTALQAKIGVQNFGNYSNSDFSTGVLYKLLSLNTGDISRSDNEITGFLDLRGKWLENSIGAGAFVDLHSYDGDWMNFIQVSANSKMKFNKMTLGLNAGIQLANGTADANLFSVLALADLEYFVNQNITMKTQLSHSMENNNIQRLFELNPYLSDSAAIDFNRVTQLKAMFSYHPENNAAVSLGANIALGSNTPIFVNADTNTFKLVYKGTFLFSVFSEGYYKFSSKDELIYNIRFLVNKAGNDFVTYDPAVRFTAQLKHSWIDELTSSIGATYIDKRYADLNNEIILPSYVDLHFFTEYRIQKNWSLFIKINNILNQNIYIWNGYRERGLFLSGGINYLF